MNWRTSVTAISRGNAGNRRTLRAMSALARESSIDPVVVQAAQDAVRPFPERNPDSDFAAILADVRRRMRYTHDPLDAEVVKSPRYVVDATNSGRWPEPMDCDDASTLAGAMLGAIGYPTKFVTAAADRSRPKEWSHVYLTVQHPDGRWIPIDPIVREFEVGDEVPAAQLTSPRAYHEGVTPMRGIGCEPSTVGVGTAMSGLGYTSRGMGSSEADAWGAIADSRAAADYSGGASAGDGTPWYAPITELATIAGGAYTAKQRADIAASNARAAAANASLVARLGRPAAGGTFFTNADGSLKTMNVVVAVGAVGLAAFAFAKMAGGRRRR